MRRIPRDPIRFDLFEVYGVYGREEQLSLTDPSAAQSFVHRARTSIEDGLKNDAFLYGLRTEAMFEALVASLGQVRLLKREDTSDVFTSENRIELPDFRIVLTDGQQWLVEVKNFYQGKQPTREFAMTTAYLEGLQRYSVLMGCPLRMAIYWARWNIWTLISPDHFRRKNSRMVIELGEAMQANELVILGDKSVATKFPLRLRFLADKEKPRSVSEDGLANFVISSVELYCEDRNITDPVERQIATFLMFYGRWQFDGPYAVIVDDELEGVECQWTPQEDHKQGFEIVGSLSDMFSTFYAWNTLDEDKVVKLRAEVVPGYLGNLIPEGYKGDALPLWRFNIHPKDKPKPTS